MPLPTAFYKFLATASGLELGILTGKQDLCHPEKDSTLSKKGLAFPWHLQQLQRQLSVCFYESHPEVPRFPCPLHREFQCLTILPAFHMVKKCLKVIMWSSWYCNIYILLWAKLSFPNSVGAGLLISVWTHAKLLHYHSGASACGTEKRSTKNRFAIELLRLADTSRDLA